MNFPVIIEKGTSNYSTFSPDIPGCAATGGSVEEVLEISGRQSNFISKVL
jgi:predicted RNase H-like HicB family nuclease